MTIVILNYDNVFQETLELENSMPFSLRKTQFDPVCFQTHLSLKDEHSAFKYIS